MLIQITPQDWAIAALMGEARRRSNEKVRNSNRDRGYKNNVHVDLMGSISELTTFRVFSKYMSQEEQEKQRDIMFSLGGGARQDGADFYLDLHPHKLKLDVKSYDCAPNKRFFAINSKKHHQLKGKCDGYSCMLLPKYGSFGYLIPKVEYNDISLWESKALGSYGDPSYNMRIIDFTKKYASSSTINQLINHHSYSRNEINAELKNEETYSKFFSLCPAAKQVFINKNLAA